MTRPENRVIGDVRELMRKVANARPSKELEEEERKSRIELYSWRAMMQVDVFQEVVNEILDRR